MLAYIVQLHTSWSREKGSPPKFIYKFVSCSKLNMKRCLWNNWVYLKMATGVLPEVMLWS